MPVSFNLSVTIFGEATKMEELKRRLEVLLGTKPDAPVDESQKEAVESVLDNLAKNLAQVLGSS